MDKESKKTAVQLLHASSIGLGMIVPIFGCLFLGVWLDGRLGTKPWLTLLFLLLGIAAGFRNLWHLTRRAKGPDR